MRGKERMVAALRVKDSGLPKKEWTDRHTAGKGILMAGC